MPKKQDIYIREIRELAKRFTPEEIDSCIAQQLQTGENVCEVTGPTDHVINELAKAHFVRNLMEKGTALSEAVRELARRIRLVQKGFKQDDPRQR
jgi:hypothetical protein